MARQEHDREDLLGEAKNLVERIELQIPHETEPVVVGFRESGSVSFYFGGEPVYQFNSVDALRRAYDRGLLYKAEQGMLVSLRRVRSGKQTVLQRHELDAVETDAFLAALKDRLLALLKALQAGEATMVGQVPEDAPVMSRAVERIPDLLNGRLASTARAN